MTQRIKPKDKPHYVNNREFSLAVVEYIKKCSECKQKGEDIPVVTRYIGECFLRIANGLSFKSNFSGYTYRDEMAMDAVENCLKAIHNFSIDIPTRGGHPNAFSYFTQISWFAFLRRIAKEKKQQEIKLRYIKSAGVDEFMSDDTNVNQFFVDTLRGRLDQGKEEKVIIDTTSKGPSGLENFMG